jgi:hypothetical protein
MTAADYMRAPLPDEPPDDDHVVEWNGSMPGHGQEDGDLDEELRALKVESLRLKLLSAEDLARIPPPEPLIDGILHKRTLTVLFAKPGSAKSFIAADWGLCLATGTRWFHYAVDPCKVLFVAAEGVEGLHKRVEAWKVERRAQVIPADQWQVLPEPCNLFDPKSAGTLCDLVAAQGYGLVIIDTLARSALGADENSARDMGQVIEAADTIRRSTGATVLLVHHQGRSGDNLRGSTAIDGAAHAMWRTEMTGQTVVLTCEKSKDTAKPAPINLELVDRGESAVLRLAGPGDLTDGPLGMLRTLADIDDGTGVSGSVWKVSSDVADRSFYRWQNYLVTQGLAAKGGTEHRPLYSLTPLGKARVQP